MNNIADRIKELRISNGMTQAQLGQKVGVTSVTISKWELETSKPKADSLIRMCKIFSVSIEWLKDGKNVNFNLGISGVRKEEELLYIPYFEGVETCNDNEFLEKSDYEFILPKHLMKLESDSLICIKMKGNSMEPVFKHNAIICVNKDDQHVYDGSIYMVCHNNMLRIKCIEKQPNGYILKSFNSSYNDVHVLFDDQFKIIGKIVMQLSFYQ
ncbi:XRE family transcriptional regulator [Aliivibrio salmonicida]|uniref:XRE family transcriptional regulator n=1 Tax=Aliivibrio salmonicida TaxID=40269 RepID=UPI003D0FE12E